MNIKTNLKTTVALLLTSISAFSQGVVNVNFNDLQLGSGQSISNGYNGLSWNNVIGFDYNTLSSLSNNLPDGYLQLYKVTKDNFITSVGDNSMVLSGATPFDFLGGMAVPENANKLTPPNKIYMTVTGYRNGVLVGTVNSSWNDVNPHDIGGRLANVDTLIFSRGTDAFNNNVSMLLTDLRFQNLPTVVPEPSTIAMATCGILTLLLFRRRQ